MTQVQDEVRTSSRWNDLLAILVLLVLTGISVSARKGGLHPSSLWLDDAWLALGYKMPWSDLPHIGFTAPGFAALTKLAGSWFGTSSLVFQAIPFVAGVLLAPGTFWVLLRRTGHMGVAAITSLLVVWAPVHVEHSIRVKQYTLEGLLGLGLLYLAWRLLDSLDDQRIWRSIGVLSVISMAVSAPLIVVVVSWCVVLAVAVLLDNRRKQLLRVAIPWFVALGIFAVVYWAVLLRTSVSPQLRSYWSAFYLPTDQGLGVFISRVRIQLGTTVEVMFSPRPVRWVKALVATSAVVVLVRRPYVGALFVVPVGLSVVLAALKIAPIGGGRTDSHLLPGLVLLVGLAAAILVDVLASRRAPLRYGVQVLALLVGLWWTKSNSFWIPAYPPEDIRPAVEEIEDRRIPTDSILVYYSSAWSFALYHSGTVYVRDDDPFLNFAQYQPGFEDPRIVLMGVRRGATHEYAIWVDEAIEVGDRVWFVTSHVLNGEQEIVGAMFEERGYERESVTPLAGAQLELWVPGS